MQGGTLNKGVHFSPEAAALWKATSFKKLSFGIVNAPILKISHVLVSPPKLGALSIKDPTTIISCLFLFLLKSWYKLLSKGLYFFWNHY